MAASHTRLDELRRRVQQDPASTAFAQLAEECRRVGELDEAVRVCRAGLERHPAYLSAHVTLGRALTELGQDAEALAEFEYVLRAAPDNLLALRSREELRKRQPPSPEDAPPDAPVAVPTAAAATPAAPAPAADPALEELEGWLANIRADRAAR